MGENKSFWLLTSSLAIILIVGLVISVIQTQHKKTVRSGADTTSLQNCSVNLDKLVITTEEQSLFDQINLYRQQYGLNTLAWSDSLIRGASWMSNDMLANGSLSHIDSLGRNVPTRLSNCGYTAHTSLAENIDSGSRDSQTIFNAWKHSPTHNANLLNSNFKEAGIALAEGSASSSYYWTLDLGNRENLTSPAPSVSMPLSPTPTTVPVPSPTPTPITVYPTLESLDPNPAFSGSKVSVIGRGGYKKYWNGFLEESGRYFQLYFDSQANSKISCYINRCQGVITIPETSNGTHIVSVEGGSKLNLTITKLILTATPTLIPLPTHPPIPTETPVPTMIPTPTTPPDYVPNPDDLQLFVSVKVTGIGIAGNRNPKHLTRHVVVGIYDLGNKLVAEGSGFIIYDRINLFRGVIHFGPVENGTYFVKILGDHMLRAIVLPTFQILHNGRLNLLPELTLLQGDINDDNVINIQDYNLALTCFQSRKCKDKDRELIDFNDDSLSDVVDYNILLHNYWESQGD